MSSLDLDRLSRVSVLLLMAAALGFFTWNAWQSGEAASRGGTIRRDQQPEFFYAYLIGRAGIVLFALVLAALLVAGWID